MLIKKPNVKSLVTTTVFDTKMLENTWRYLFSQENKLWC